MPSRTRPSTPAAPARPAAPAPAVPARPAAPVAPAGPSAAPEEEPAPAAPTAKPSARPAQDKLDAAIQAKADEEQAKANAPRPGAEAPPAPSEPAAEPAAGTPAKPGKVNPWKERDEWRNKAVSAEAEVQRLKTSVLPENDRTALTERATKAEARAAELENAIRFKDYEQSTEFKDKYHQPFLNAFQDAMAELGELQVTDPGTGRQRPVTGDDFAKLANLSLKEAKAAATEMFGEFAETAMEHRAQIRRVAAARAQALEEAKTKGAEREQQTKEQRDKATSELVGFTRNTFKQVNDAILADKDVGDFFSPKTPPEGQQPTPEEAAWNDRLAKGFKLVDEGWAKNPMNPNLSAEQRQTIIAQHAAIRNRAAAFGPMRWEIGQLRAKLAALEADLAQYGESTPPAGGSQPAAPGARPVSAHQELYTAIEQAAMKRR